MLPPLNQISGFFFTAVFMTALCLFLFPRSATAQECPINLFKPWDDVEVNEALKIRSKHPVTGKPNRRHTGVDLNIPGSGDCGAPIALSDNCTDIDYKYRNGYGNTLRRDCGNGVEEWYTHLSNYQPGVAYVGTTGGSTGCHLHYEIRIDDSFVDPVCVWDHNDPNRFLNDAEIADHGNVTCPDLTGGTSFGGTTAVPDLCNEQVRQALKDDAEAKLNGQSGASSPGSGSGQAPQTENTNQPSLGPGVNVPSGYEGGSDTQGVYTPPVVNIYEPENPPDTPATPPPPATASGIGSGITQEIIDTAKNEYVDNAEEDPHLDYILPPEDDCQAPAMTGLITNRRYGGGNKLAQIRTYDDAFCTQQGCAFVNELFNISGGGEGECKL